MQSINSTNDPNEILRVSEYIKPVQDWLAESPPRIEDSKEALTQAVQLLGDNGSDSSNELREKALDLWCSIAVALEDLNAVHQTLLEGVQLFVGLPSTQRLETMLSQVEQVFSIQHVLMIEPDQSWPGWFGEEDAPPRITRVVKAFDQLGELRNWPYLQNQIDRYYAAFFDNMLPAFLESLYLSARQYARERNFAMSGFTAEKVIKLLRHEVRPYLNLNFKEDELHQLKDTLAIREKAEVALWSAAVRLTDPEIMFGEIIPDISVLIINHPDVPVQDLNSLLGDFYKADKVETKFLQLMDLEHFSENAITYQSIEAVHFDILEELPEFLQQADLQLATKLQSRFKSLAESFNNIPDKIALALVDRIRESYTNDETITQPKKFLRYYWQAYWSLTSGLLCDPSVVEIVQGLIPYTEEVLDHLLTRNATRFSEIASVDELDQARILLNSFRVLNAGMAHNRNNNQILVHNLPPLPVGTSFPESAPIYQIHILEKWADILRSWGNVFSQSSISVPPADSKNGNIQDAKTIVFEMMRDLSILKKDIWPGLNLKQWSLNSQLAKIDRQVYQLHQLITTESELNRIYGTKSAIDTLVYLDEQLIDSNLMDDLESGTSWLLKSPNQILLREMRNRYQEVRKEVNAQIRLLFDEKNEISKRIQDELLTKPTSPTTAEFLKNLLISNANRLTDIYVHSTDIKAAIDLWYSLQAATKPWKKTTGEKQIEQQLNQKVAEQWQTLHHNSRREIIKLQVSRTRRELIITAAVILVGLVSWVVFNLASRKPQPAASLDAGTQTPVIQMTNTSEAQQDHLVDIAETESAYQVMTKLTSTAEMVANLERTQTVVAMTTATRQAADAIALTSTAEAIEQAYTATEESNKSQAQAATATAIARLTATAESLLCIDPANYSFQATSNVKLDPSPGTTHIFGTNFTQPTAWWEITNTGLCNWEDIALQALTDEFSVETRLLVNSQPVSNLSERPVELNDILEIGLLFNLEDATNLKGEWVVLINGLENPESPRLIIDVDNWIKLVTPPSSRP